MNSKEIIEKISQTLREDSSLTVEQVKEIATAYSKVCRDFNLRVMQCVNLLRQKRREEAVLIAREIPDLYEEFRAINFAQRSEWEEMCQKWGVPFNAELEEDVASTLISDLYGEDKSLERLLRNHRKMAIGLAPLEARVKVLRQLRWADPERKSWADDLVTFEIAFQEELVSKASLADREGDLEAIENVLSELKSNDWLEPPAKKYIEAVDKMAYPHRRKSAYAQFNDLEKLLAEAHSSMNERQCCDILLKVRKVVERTGIEPTASLIEILTAVNGWLNDLQKMQNEESAFQEACSAFENALEENVDQHTLENMAATILRMGRGMPDLLGARFKSRMEESQQRSKRKFTLALTIIVGALLLVATGVTTLVIKQNQRLTIQKWQEQIATTLGKDDLEGTEKLFKNIENTDSDLLKAPELLSLQRQYDEKKKMEKNREFSFQRAIAALQKAGVATANETMLKEASDLARTFSEKNAVEDWRQKMEEYAREQRKINDDKFSKRLKDLDQLSTEFKEIVRKGVPLEELQQAAQKPLECAAELANIKNVSSPLMTQAMAIQQSTLKIIENARKDAARKDALYVALTGISQMYDRPDDLAKALKAFGKDFPEQVYASDFAQAATMVDQWKAIRAWRNKIKKWGMGLDVQDSKEAESRINDIEAFQKEFQDNPYKDGIKRYIAYLKNIQSVEDGSESKGFTTVETILNSPLLADSFILKTKDGRMYYLFKDKIDRNENRSTTYSIEYAINGAGGTNVCTLERREVDGKPVPAPQTIFVKKAKEIINSHKNENQAVTYLRLADLVITQKESDPILRANLVKLFLEYARNSSIDDTGDIGDHMNKLSAVDIDVTWMDPDCREANNIRNQVSRILEEIKTVNSLLQDIQKKDQEMKASLKSYEPVGVLLDRNSRMKISKLIEKGNLYVLVSSDDGKYTMKKIGTVIGKEGKIDIGEEDAYPLGSLVFTAEN
jgi:hypothetical protein